MSTCSDVILSFVHIKFKNLKNVFVKESNTWSRIQLKANSTKLFNHMILLHSITDGIYLHSWCKILNSVHETLKPDPCPQTETVKTEVCEPPIFLFSPTLHSTSDFSSVNKHSGVLCVSLSGQCMLLYICLLAAAVGSGRPKPKGFPQHPGTSCLPGAAPVVEMERHMHKHEPQEHGTEVVLGI